jgi:hypothetical protein
MKILCLVEEEDHNIFFFEAKWQERCLSFYRYFLFASLLSEHKFMTLFFA